MLPLYVYTAITGRFDNQLRPPENFTDPQGRPIKFVCFSDCIFSAPDPWILLPPVWEHEQPRRTARYHKVMPHEVLPDASFWLWMDGNQQLVTNPWGLVDDILKGERSGAKLATYKHPDRCCVYEELEACIRMKKDDPKLMRAQVTRYRQEGYPKENGLAETTVMLRRNTKAVCKFNERWWKEIVQGSLRDQLSFDYTVWTLGGDNYNYIPGQRDRPQFFRYFPHR
jgi:hypothetical protein